MVQKKKKKLTQAPNIQIHFCLLLERDKYSIIIIIIIIIIIFNLYIASVHTKAGATEVTWYGTGKTRPYAG